MSTRELPRAIYAAAGAGDLAYRRLRRLPEATTRTLRAAAELRERAAARPYRLDRRRLSADLARLREQARRGGAVLAARAAAAQERAVAGYHHLVVHGEQVMASRTGGNGAGGPSPAQVTAHPSGAAGAEPDVPGTPASDETSTDETSTDQAPGRRTAG
jgi:hypothetical protein